MTSPGPVDPPESRPAIPRYGEYAPPGYVSPIGAQVPAPPASPTTRPSAVDRTATTLLLTLGCFVTTAIVFAAIQFNDSMQTLYTSNGLGQFEPSAASLVVQIILATSHPIALVLAVVISLRRQRRAKRTFWVPLVAGACAATIYYTTTLIFVLSDHALTDALLSTQKAAF
jgi:glucan phosphoethanolaminetransferase (alkaline phosphatase superfamily)